MRRVIRRVIKIIVLLVILLAGLALVAGYFVNANRFKPFIINRVYQMTGLELVMDGNLTWSFFPRIGITTGHVGLKNPPGSKQLYLAEADRVRVSVHLLPLLKRDVQSGAVAINNARLDWSNPTPGARQTLSISHLNFYAENASLDKAFPVQVVLDFKTSAPQALGHLSLKAQASVNPSAQRLSLRQLILKGDVRTGAQKIPFQLGGDWQVNGSAKQFTWEDMKGEVATIPVTGYLRRMGTGQPVTNGLINMASFNLQTVFKKIGVDIPVLQQADGVDGVINIASDAAELTVGGTFRAPRVQVANLLFQGVTVPFRFRNNVLDIVGARSRLYGGTVSAQVVVKMQTATPQTAAQIGLNDVQLEPLLNDLDAKRKVSLGGTGDVVMLLTSSGVTLPDFLSHLNGSVRFGINKGVLKGIDIGFYLDSALALAGQTVSPVMQGNTSFGEVRGTALIRNGIVSNQDLQIDAPRFTASGKGVMDLPQDKINYALEARLRSLGSGAKDDVTTLFGLPVPILVTGRIEAPTVHFDKETFLKAIARQQVQKAVKNIIPKELENKIPGKAGAVLNDLLGQ